MLLLESSICSFLTSSSMLLCRALIRGHVVNRNSNLIRLATIAAVCFHHLPFVEHVDKLAAKDSDVILLDEPTSSVDPKTEVKSCDKLFQGFADKAILSTLHRLHLLPKFDYIYIMDRGRIIDEGTFDNLFASSAIFQEMWAHQEQLV